MMRVPQQNVAAHGCRYEQTVWMLGRNAKLQRMQAAQKNAARTTGNVGTESLPTSVMYLVSKEEGISGPQVSTQDELQACS
ncbi:MAG: hypothetical protein ACI9VM_000284 [Candidatus Azotimanducaceae bacterium]|jgi:hypothetical protein